VGKAKGRGARGSSWREGVAGVAVEGNGDLRWFFKTKQPQKKRDGTEGGGRQMGDQGEGGGGVGSVGVGVDADGGEGVSVGEDGVGGEEGAWTDEGADQGQRWGPSTKRSRP
jgi:hypothetical protein